MGKNKKVKLKAQKMALAEYNPKILILDFMETTEVVDVRANFVATIAGALVAQHSDLGGRDDEKIVAAAFRLGDLLTERYFNT